MIRNSRLFVLIFLSFGLYACIASKAAPSISMIQTAIAQTQSASPITKIEAFASTPTQSFDNTSIPNDIHLEVVRSTDIVTSTNEAAAISETPSVFLDAYVYGMANLDNGHLLITIQVDGNPEGSFYATVGDERFRCVVLEDYPDRLYCNGITSYPGEYVPFRIYHNGEDEAIFETEIGIPPSLTLIKEDDKPAHNDSEPESTPSPTGTPVPPYPYP